MVEIAKIEKEVQSFWVSNSSTKSKIERESVKHFWSQIHENGQISWKNVTPV